MTAWTLEYDHYDADTEQLREALCTVGNGYFGTRGAAPFARAGEVHYPGTYVAGLFDRLTTRIDTHDVANEDLVNLPNWLPLTFRVLDDVEPRDDRAAGHGRAHGGPESDEHATRAHGAGDADESPAHGAGDADESPAIDGAWNDGWFELDDVEVLDYHQSLDLRKGVLIRRMRVADDQGRRTLLSYRQFVSMAHRHVGAVDMTLQPENWSGRVAVRSALDGHVTNWLVARYRDLRGDHLVPLETAVTGEQTTLLLMRTRQSQIRVAEAARTRLWLDDESIDPPRSVRSSSDVIASDYVVDLAQGATLRVEKVAALFTSRDSAISESAEQACRRLEVAGDVRELLEDHMLAWKRIWDTHRLGIDDEDAQRVLNLHIFHLLQTVSENSIDLDVGVPARGLHGEAYRGHIFWDEIFIFPYLNMRLPELTRSLLLYRYRRLPEARRLARDAGHAGATFPWQSGSDGREESQTLHLNPKSGRWTPDNSNLQRHINFAIAYNIWQYFHISGDVEFLAFYGGEIIIEIARFLTSVATYNSVLDRYEIHGVMGPDEYHEGYPWRDGPGLDNNTYTNVMTVWTLLRAMDALAALPPGRRQDLAARVRLRESELVAWEDITRNMRICFHDGGIPSQFEGYERLEEFDWEGYRNKYGDISRLDRILEAEDDTPNRYKVSKQADVLMLFYLFTVEELGELFARLGYTWDDELIERTVEYYTARTSHGSTLSRVVHSWVHARLDRTRSFELFRDALQSDIADIQGGTTPEGIHLGAMAGTVDMVQRGYTGLQPRGDVLWLNPMLPDELPRLEFTLRYRDAWDALFDINQQRIRVSAPAGAGMKVGYDGRIVEVQPGTTVDLPLD